MLRIHWREKVTNVKVLKRVGKMEISSVKKSVQNRQLYFLVLIIVMIYKIKRQYRERKKALYQEEGGKNELLENKGAPTCLQ